MYMLVEGGIDRSHERNDFVLFYVATGVSRDMQCKWYESLVSVVVGFELGLVACKGKLDYDKKKGESLPCSSMCI